MTAVLLRVHKFCNLFATGWLTRCKFLTRIKALHVLNSQSMLVCTAVLFVYCIGAGCSCQASTEETEPFLVFINTTEINRVNIDGTNYQTIVTGLSNGIAIDYDYYNDWIYWTDVGIGQIRTTPLNTGNPIYIIVSGNALLCMYHIQYVKI